MYLHVNLPDLTSCTLWYGINIMLISTRNVQNLESQFYQTKEIFYPSIYIDFRMLLCLLPGIEKYLYANKEKYFIFNICLMYKQYYPNVKFNERNAFMCTIIIIMCFYLIQTCLTSYDLWPWCVIIMLCKYNYSYKTHIVFYAFIIINVFLSFQ